jgi:hypothetical protein
MRLFILYRLKDESGVSGTGIVAEGVVFSDGHVALRWITKVASSTALYDTIEDMIAVHGHGGLTRIRYVGGLWWE